MERTERILLKATPAEKAMLRERAERLTGGNVSALLRLAGLGQLDERGGRKKVARRPELAVDEFEAKVARLARSMPRRNAEVIARREMAKEAA